MAIQTSSEQKLAAAASWLANCCWQQLANKQCWLKRSERRKTCWGRDTVWGNVHRCGFFVPNHLEVIKVNHHAEPGKCASARGVHHANGYIGESSLLEELRKSHRFSSHLLVARECPRRVSRRSCDCVQEAEGMGVSKQFQIHCHKG